MFDLKTTKAQAAEYTAQHGKKWIVMETSPESLSRKAVFNMHNTGPYIAVPRDEALDYAEGGCTIKDMMT